MENINQNIEKKPEKIKVGFAICGSFCTFSKIIAVINELVKENYDIFPILSQISAVTDTRFYKSFDFVKKLEEITNHQVISSIVQAEPIGPKKLFDIVVVAPCTGNTLAKLACGITDTSVTMAVKAHLRNLRPIIIGVSTNDALSNSSKNIGILQNLKNIYFIPMKQDDPKGKPNSIVADFSLIDETIKSSLKGVQIQPVYL